MPQGTCICGSVKIEVSTPLPAPDACHCTTCRKWTGHYLVSSDILRSSITILGEEHVRWFRSSDKVRRGFCSHCGASLFFDPIDSRKHDWLAVAMGVFTVPTGTRLSKHIFTAEKGDYYDIQDGLPQNEH